MVSALTGVMSPLLDKLTNLMSKEYAKLKGARKELMAINVMLEEYTAMETRLKNLHYRHKFVAQIQEFLVLMNDACERQKRYKFDEIDCTNLHTEIDPRLPALYVEVEKLVGIQDPTEEIIKPANWSEE